MNGKVCVIGAGPAGLAAARALRRHGVEYDQLERHSGVGGLWDIDNPGSAMYECAHFISSRTMSGFARLPDAGGLSRLPLAPADPRLPARLHRRVRAGPGDQVRHRSHRGGAGPGRWLVGRDRGRRAPAVPRRDLRQRRAVAPVPAAAARPVRRRDPAQQQLSQPGRPARPAGTGGRRGQLRLRHRGRRQPGHAARVPQRAARVLVHPEAHLRRPQRRVRGLRTARGKAAGAVGAGGVRRPPAVAARRSDQARAAAAGSSAAREPPDPEHRGVDAAAAR